MPPTRGDCPDTLVGMELRVGPNKRLRCAKCGNLTRFDVVATTRARTYWHFDLSGSPTAEESEIIEQVVESIQCRWCGAAEGIEEVPVP